MTCYCSSNSFYAVVVVRSESTAANQAVYDNAGPYTNYASYYITAAWARRISPGFQSPILWEMAPEPI